MYLLCNKECCFNMLCNVYTDPVLHETRTFVVSINLLAPQARPLSHKLNGQQPGGM